MKPMSYRSTVVELLVRRDGNLCAKCGEELFSPVHVHHAIPRTEGGQDTLDNFKLVHDSCHLACHDKHPRQEYIGPLPEGVELNEGEVFLTAPQAAQLLGISRQAVWYLVKSQKLQAERVGRTWLILRSSVEERQRTPRKSSRPSEST